MPWRENKGVANLNGIYTDGLGLPVGKKSLEEIFNKEWPGQKRITMLLDFGSCFARCFGVAKTE